MPSSVCGSTASSKSKRGTLAQSSLQSDVVEKGPITKNGIVYLKVRRCPCCRLLSTDLNLVKSGPLTVSATVVWHEGSSTNPVGRLDRVCFVVFTQGGFAEQFEGLQAFLLERQDSRSLMEEWSAAYEYVVKLGDELPMRMSKVY